VEGDYSDEETLVVIAIGHPPTERRAVARYVGLTQYQSGIDNVDFLGKGATTVLEDVSGPSPFGRCSTLLMPVRKGG